MWGTSGVRARRTSVTEAPNPRMPVHYADAFIVRLPDPDGRTAEAWVRYGLEEAPRPIRAVIRIAHRHVLRFALLPARSSNQVLGWRITEARPDVIYLAASSPILRGVIVARRPDERSAVLTTLLSYERPAIARAMWNLVGPLHRRIAPLLLERAAMPMSS
jgi:hypothetical protein